jgi:microcystin-dependent protein
MQRVSRSSAVPSLPAAPSGGTPGYFTGGNPGIGQAATVPGFEWFNGVQEELIGMLTRAGITPLQGDLTQLRQSLDRLYGGGLVSYAANATLTPADAGLVLVDASGGARTIILPAASAMNARPIPIRVVKTDSSVNTVTVERAGADLIEGMTALILTGQFATAALISNGSNLWHSAVPAPALIGSIAFFAATAAPSGWVKANGALLQRSTFANLWTFAQASGNLVSDAAWLAANGPTGAFSTGNGTTTFRIPDLRGEFLRGWDDGRGVDVSRGIGGWQSDAFQGHYHSLTYPNTGAIGGSLTIGLSTNANTNILSNVAQAPITDGSNGTPRTASETRPRNVALLACIKF